MCNRVHDFLNIKFLDMWILSILNFMKYINDLIKIIQQLINNNFGRFFQTGSMCQVWNRIS